VIELYTKAIKENSIFANRKCLCKRGYAYSRLDLHQKALDDYNEASCARWFSMFT